MHDLDKNLFFGILIVSLLLLFLITDWCKKLYCRNASSPNENNVLPSLSEQKERRRSFIAKHVQIRKITPQDIANTPVNKTLVEYGAGDGDTVNSQSRNDGEQSASVITSNNGHKRDKEITSLQKNDKTFPCCVTKQTSSIESRSSKRKLSSLYDYDEEAPPDDDLLLCSICLTTFKVGDEICSSSNEGCTHVFHYECIILWLMSHDECPMCRQKYMKVDSCDELDKRVDRRDVGPAYIARMHLRDPF